MNARHTPVVLEIIRTASADCRANNNTMAANELLTASVMTRGLIEALETAIMVADERQGIGKQMPTFKQWWLIQSVARAAITKATGAAS